VIKPYLKRFIKLTWLAVVSLLLTACNPDDVSIQNTEGYEAETEPTTQAVEENSTPQKGGTLKLAMHKPDTLNPLLNKDVTVDEVLKLVFAPLFTADEEMDVVPVLAESYSVAADGLSTTIKLKSGVTWQDGTSVTASDLIYTLDVLKEADADVIYKNALNGVKDYVKIDNLTVKLNYETPVGGCMYNLCFPIVPKNYYQSADNSTVDDDGFLITDVDRKAFKPVGNGYYAFESYEYVQKLVLKSASGFLGTPYIDEIDVTILDDDDTFLSAYQAGLLDVLNTDLTQWGSLGSDDKTTAAPYSTTAFEFIGMNNKRTPFSNLSYRQAFAYAVPIDNIIESIYLGNITKSLTPYTPVSLLTSSVGMESYDYSVQNAKTMLSTGGFSGDELKVEILVNSENNSRVESANLLAKSLNMSGFTASVTAVGFDEYKKRITDDDFDVFIGSINVREDMDLTEFLGSGAVYGGKNYSNFSDERMDRLLDDVANASDTDKYKLALSEASKYCSNQLPVIGIGFKDDMLLTKDRVKGIKKPLDGYIFGNINEWYIKE
jgi:peptide/nickel transport system substrate-binding protein